MWFDIAVAAVAAAENGVEAASFATSHGLGAPLWTALVCLLGAAAGATLVLRRRLPLLPVLVALLLIPAQFGYMQLVVGLYTLAAVQPSGREGRWRLRRVMKAVCGIAVAESVTVSVLRLSATDAAARQAGHVIPWYVLVMLSALVAVGVTVPPVVLGLYVGARRRLWESLRERAEGLETELALLAEQAQERALRARIEERTRIARDMHDVVAHRVSLMVVHSAALERVVATDPDKAARSARLMGDIGRQALDELRQILGVLRTVETGEQASPASAGRASVPGQAQALLPVPAQAAALAQGAETTSAGETPGGAGAAAGGEPAPGAVAVADGADGSGDAGDAGDALAGLRRIVDESRAAGLSVRFTVGGELRPLRAETERTAYRVVQEALTNVLKHAPGAAAEVAVDYVREELALVVSNACPGVAEEARATTASAPPPPALRLPSGGNGLVGMRERVAAHGGVLHAGPTPDGGFRVEARLLVG